MKNNRPDDFVDHDHIYISAMVYMQSTCEEDTMGDDEYWGFLVINFISNSGGNVLGEDKIGSVEGYAV